MYNSRSFLMLKSHSPLHFLHNPIRSSFLFNQSGDNSATVNATKVISKHRTANLRKHRFSFMILREVALPKVTTQNIIVSSKI